MTATAMTATVTATAKGPRIDGTSYRKLVVPDRGTSCPPAGHEVDVIRVTKDTDPTNPRKGIIFVAVRHSAGCQKCQAEAAQKEEEMAEARAEASYAAECSAFRTSSAFAVVKSILAIVREHATWQDEDDATSEQRTWLFTARALTDTRPGDRRYHKVSILINGLPTIGAWWAENAPKMKEARAIKLARDARIQEIKTSAEYQALVSELNDLSAPNPAPGSPKPVQLTGGASIRIGCTYRGIAIDGHGAIWYEDEEIEHSWSPESNDGYRPEMTTTRMVWGWRKVSTENEARIRAEYTEKIEDATITARAEWIAYEESIKAHDNETIRRIRRIPEIETAMKEMVAI